MKIFNTLFFAPRAIRHVEIVEGDVSDWEYIGAGMIRACYRIPGTLECLKFYRTTEKAERAWKWDTYWRVRLTRHLFWPNINMQEWRYYERLKKRLPRDVMAVFPEEMEPVYSPRLGWGVRETLLVNADGTPICSVVKQMQRFKNDPDKEILFLRVSALIDQLVKYTVAMHDPQNILIQWLTPEHYQLRIVDFEPRTKAFFPGLTYIRPYLRSRIANRCARYLRLLRQGMLVGFGDEEG